MYTGRCLKNISWTATRAVSDPTDVNIVSVKFAIKEWFLEDQESAYKDVMSFIYNSAVDKHVYKKEFDKHLRLVTIFASNKLEHTLSNLLKRLMYTNI